MTGWTLEIAKDYATKTNLDLFEYRQKGLSSSDDRVKRAKRNLKLYKKIISELS